MRYELTVTIEVESPFGQDRVARQFAALFDFGTLKESVAEGLRLRNDPQLVRLSVQKRVKPERV